MRRRWLGVLCGAIWLVAGWVFWTAASPSESWVLEREWRYSGDPSPYRVDRFVYDSSRECLAYLSDLAAAESELPRLGERWASYRKVSLVDEEFQEVQLVTLRCVRGH